MWPKSGVTLQKTYNFHLPAADWLSETEVVHTAAGGPGTH